MSPNVKPSPTVDKSASSLYVTLLEFARSLTVAQRAQLFSCLIGNIPWDKVPPGIRDLFIKIAVRHMEVK